MFPAKRLDEGRMQPGIIAIGEPMLDFNVEKDGVNA